MGFETTTYVDYGNIFVTFLLILINFPLILRQILTGKPVNYGMLLLSLGGGAWLRVALGHMSRIKVVLLS